MASFNIWLEYASLWEQTVEIGYGKYLYLLWHSDAVFDPITLADFRQLVTENIGEKINEYQFWKSCRDDTELLSNSQFLISSFKEPYMWKQQLFEDYWAQ